MNKFAPLTRDEKLKRMKAWAVSNYNKGADAIVECWDDNDHYKIIDDNTSIAACMRELKEAAGLWVEQNLNARWGEDDDDCLSMLK
jgi:hypothetical protein